MGKWNYEAMGEVGLSGIAAKIAAPIAASISRRTGRPQNQILAIMGAAFLAVVLIDFLRTFGSVVAAGRSTTAPTDPPAT